jgi:hypothetical protein
MSRIPTIAGEQTELSAQAGLPNYFNCFNYSLKMEPTR